MSARAVFFVAVHCVIASCAVLAGCPPEPTTPEAPRHQRADAVPAARHLPAVVQLVAVTEDLEAFLDAAGRNEMAARFRARYEQIAFDLGYDIFSPGGLSDIGIDVRGQAGLAVLAERGEPSFAAFVTLAHPDRFKNVVYMLARAGVPGFRATMSVVGDTVVVGASDRAIVLADRVAILVLAKNALGVARQLAGMPAETSLAEEPAFSQAMQHAGPGADVRGYFDLRAVAYLQAGLDPRWRGATQEEAAAVIEKYHRAALAQARSDGASLAEILAIDGRYRVERQTLADDEFDKRIRGLAGSIGGGRFVATLAADGADATFELDLPESAVLRRLFASRKGQPALVSALDQLPALMATVSVDLDTVLSIAEALELPLAEINILFGIDLQSQVLPLLSGEVGLAITAPGDDLAKLQNAGDMGIAAVIGVKDAAKVDAFVAKLIDGGLGAVLQPKGKRAWTMMMPEVGELSVRLTDTHLVVSRDASVAERVAASGRKGGLPREPPCHVLRQGTSGAALVQLAAIAALQLEAEPSAGALVFPWHDPRVPKSPQYAAKLGELQKAEDAIRALEHPRFVRGRERTLALLKPLGYVAAGLTTTATGLELRASHRTTGPTLVAVLGAYDRHAEQKDDLLDAPATAAALRAQRDQLEAELEKIYARDVKASQQPPPPTPTPPPPKKKRR